jgi:hypothetical protein
MARTGASAIRRQLDQQHHVALSIERRYAKGAQALISQKAFASSFAVSARTTSVASIENSGRWKKKGSPVVFCHPFPIFSSSGFHPNR